jgi:hypothetical protein
MKGESPLKLSELLEHNRANHYQLLVVVDNSNNPHKIINALKDEGWEAFNVNRSALRLMSNVPMDKIQLRIADEIKKWVLSLPDKVIFYNANILYSPDFGKMNPISAFKYRARNKEIIVIMEGQLSGNRLVYSQHGRSDYTEMDVGELICVRMEDIDV